MAAIIPLPGKSGVFTVNGVTVRLTKISLKVSNEVGKYATTGQTADADSQYWMNKISGLNDWSIQATGYIDFNAVAASRLTGDNIKFRPGTGAAGTVVIAWGANYGISGSVVVADIGPDMDAESSKPDTFSVTLEGDGTLTYTNS